MPLPFATYEKLIKHTITREFTQSWIKNRHKLTGKLLKDLVIDVKQSVDNIMIEVFAYKYGIIQDKGVSASKIPFSGSNGKGGKSLYIEGLTRYVEQRIGLSGKEATSVAFAIAHKHKKTGMQIRTRGKGTQWIGQAADKIMPEIDNLTMRYLGEIVESKLKEL